MEGARVGREFWLGRKVLVTGHTGFKGGWLALWLAELGAKVCGYALAPPTRPSLFELVQLSRDIDSIEGDVRNLDRLVQVFADFKPEVVFHLAAQALVRESFEAPVETFSTNILGTVNLLEAVRQYGEPCIVVNITSDKCYENREWLWGYRETDPVGGYDPYSSSKACSEIVTAAYRRSFFVGSAADPRVAVASARAGNVIGGGDWAKDRLIPDLVRALLGEGEPALVRNPQAVRPWQHVLEPLSGYLLLAEKLGEPGHDYAESWNFGPDESDLQPVACVADRFVALWGQGARWQHDARVHPHEATYLRLDSSKARARLGWKPRWNLERALAATVEWYRAYGSGKAVREVSLTQIRAFSGSTAD